MSADVLRAWRPSKGEWDRAAATHLTRRAGFGGGPGEAATLANEPAHDALDDWLSRDAYDERVTKGVHALLPGGDTQRVAAWWMSLILSGGAPLRERATLMWHDHFATSDAKVDDVRMMYRQNELFREHGLGDFRVLLHSVAKDPAMLVWLDGGANRRGQPNENFAREVMELFALGIGNYTERDVQEAARGLTGWGTEGRAFRMRAEDHDDGEKELFGERGNLTGDDVIDRVLAQPACARHVARRLLEEFVTSSPEPAWVDDVARALITNEWHIGRTIERIVRSELFFSPAARRSRIAAPVELVAMTARGLSARIAPREATEAAARMGQALLRPPTVKGWDGMRAWINAGTWVARHNAMTTAAESTTVDWGAVLEGEDGGTPEALAATLVSVLVPDLLGGTLEARLADALRSADGSRDARASLGAALVLTAPEYHVV